IPTLSISSDTRVTPEEQAKNPEAVAVESILKDNEVLNPGDTLKVELTVDDPKAYEKVDENGKVTGTQTFIISAVDVNGNSLKYTNTLLVDGAVYTITADKLLFIADGVVAKQLKSAQAALDSAKSAHADAAIAYESAKEAAHFEHNADGSIKLDKDNNPIATAENKLNPDLLAAEEQAKGDVDAASKAISDAKAELDKIEQSISSTAGDKTKPGEQAISSEPDVSSEPTSTSAKS
ncbi:MAG: hypothetical protein RR141_07155, partial [Rikenellaceae bacterium]